MGEKSERARERGESEETMNQPEDDGEKNCDRPLDLPPPPPPKNDKQICRFVPWAVKNYRLEDMTTPAELRRNVAALFKARPPVADPRVVDVLIYKGREELESIVLQHKQRHHLVGEYVLGPRAMRKASRVAAEGVAGGRSAFLDAFLKNTA